MNKPIRYLLLSASIAAAAQAAPFMAVGDSAELFVTGVLGVRADDNVTLSKDAQNDLVFDLGIGAELVFGKGAQTQGTITVSETFQTYTDISDLNENLFNGDFVTKFDDGKMKLGFNAGYHELNQNTVDVRNNVRRDITNLGANGEVGVTEITAVGAGVNFNHENYHPSTMVDSDTLTVPLSFYYKWTPKVDVSLGYQYRDYDAKNGVAGALDSIDHFYSIGARGEFSPKLTGKFAIGYTQRRFSANYGNRSLIGLDASFAYEISAKTTLQLGATNDFGTSPTGQQQKNFTVNGMVVTKLNEEWAVRGGLSYRGIKYDFSGIGRTDDYWEAMLGADYVINANVRIIGAYTYRTFQSNLSETEFDNNVFSIAANFRY